MSRKYRLISYGALIAFALLSQLVNKGAPMWEPLSFIGLVILLGGIYEWYSYKKGKK